MSVIEKYDLKPSDVTIFFNYDDGKTMYLRVVIEDAAQAIALLRQAGFKMVPE